MKLNNKIRLTAAGFAVVVAGATLGMPAVANAAGGAVGANVNANVNIPDVPLPDFEPNIPDVPLPDFEPNIPDIPLPDFEPNIPDIPLPDFEPNIPDIPLPDFEPHFPNIPDVPLPDFEPHFPDLPVIDPHFEILIPEFHFGWAGEGHHAPHEESEPEYTVVEWTPAREETVVETVSNGYPVQAKTGAVTVSAETGSMLGGIIATTSLGAAVAMVVRRRGASQ